MSKRDRAARAKNDGQSTAADSAAEELETRDDAVEDADGGASDASSGDLRPTGKRSGRRRSSAAAVDTTDGDADSDGGSAVAVKERKVKKASEQSSNPFVRIWVFMQQVVSEMKKVIWPTRRETITYTIIVLVFVVVMTAFIFGIDIGFAKLVLWILG
ncbi:MULTISPECIES: preprotein translocase subunit SecE [Gordonia]|uniref:preprotein translocase subunit SecE n=1 Tax=Gordonia TaxID=2053 RepID=UPI0007E95B28|nr:MULTISPECIES: preprotein translocase subunit SecE [Gordonia]OBA62040.1 preprotein translocase subunit SecE [Gordonia sp. 852002-10350_SCH5691597]